MLIAGSSNIMIDIIDTNYINNLLKEADDALKETKEETTTNVVETIESKEETKKETNNNEELIKKVNEKLELIKNIEGINIEKIGMWLWIDGNTKEVKEELKQAGFKYARNKQMWYYNPDDTYRKYSKKTYSKQEIEEKYGYEIIK